MTPCPADHRLSELLAGSLAAADQSDLDTHIADCGTCQSRLETLTDSPRLSTWMDGFAGRAALAAPTRIGRFEIVEQIARGGMGIVYRARDEELGRIVAIKIRTTDSGGVEGETRFARESQAAAKLRHDHLVPVYSVERLADDRAVIVMPFIEGPTLRERLRSDPAPTLRELVESSGRSRPVSTRFTRPVWFTAM